MQIETGSHGSQVVVQNPLTPGSGLMSVHQDKQLSQAAIVSDNVCSLRVSKKVVD